MEEIKSYFTVDGRQDGKMAWFLIDTDESLKTKRMHNVCVSCHNKTLHYKGGDETNLKYLFGRDNILPKPSLSIYIKASEVLKEHGMVYNKKRGMVIKVKP